MIYDTHHVMLEAPETERCVILEAYDSMGRVG